MPEPLTDVQVLVLRALARPNTRLRWHAIKHPKRELAGRGMVMGSGSFLVGGSIAGYTVRKLVHLNLLRPIDRANARPFRELNPPYRDYSLTEEGRAVLAGATP